MIAKLNILSFLSFEFAEPEYFWALLVIPVLILFKILYRNNAPVSLTTVGKRHKPALTFQITQWVLFSLSLIGLALLITAMARPQDPKKRKEKEDSFVQGIDIMIAMDISGSMEAEDFQDKEKNIENRLDASILAARNFVDQRKDDNIGLVVYGGEAFMMSPLSTDHNNLKEKLGELTTDLVVPRTAIGDGLNLAAASIYKSEAKSKVIILLTDGVNNAGEKDPLEAAEYANAYGIKVYTIGIGKNGEATIPVDYGGVKVRQSFIVEIDEELLTDISERTGGKYYRAEDNDQLLEIYNDIDLLEKSKQKSLAVTIEPPEEFRWFAIPGLALLLLPIILNNLFFRQIP